MVDKMNVTEFNQKIQNFAKKIPMEYGLFLRGLALKLLSGVVKKTPVKTGHARRNWQVNVGSITDDEIVGESSENATIASGMAKLQELRKGGIGQVVYIYNNVPYIIALEEGHSERQAPHGMVAVTMAEIAAGF